MDTITLRDLEVHYHFGVPDEERVHPQRLLISVEMETDIRQAAATDDLAHTINYYAVSQRLLGLGRGQEDFTGTVGHEDLVGIDAMFFGQRPAQGIDQ